MIAGVPERSSAAGGIVVRDGRHTPRTVTLANVPGAGAPAPGDRFGAALASGMVSFGRPCNDLVAGAPGRNGTGEAYLLRGSTGARPREAVILRAPDAAPGDAFGAAVAISPRDETREHDIWVGAPGRDVAGQADAGAIYHWTLNLDGVRPSPASSRRAPASTRPRRATGSARCSRPPWTPRSRVCRTRTPATAPTRAP